MTNVRCAAQPVDPYDRPAAIAISAHLPFDVFLRLRLRDGAAIRDDLLFKDGGPAITPVHVGQHIRFTGV